MLQATVFIDGTWLWYEVEKFRQQIHKQLRSSRHLVHEVDYGKLVRCLLDQLAAETRQTVNLQSVHFFASCAVNVHAEDLERTQKWEKQMEVMERTYGYTLHLSEQDFKKKPVRTLFQEGKVEKMVDVDMAVEMVEYIWTGPTSDWTIVITGDLDLLPAMVKHKKAGRKVLLASSTDSCHMKLKQPELKDRAWHKLYWLDTMVEKFTWLSAEQMANEVSRVLSQIQLRR